MPDEGLRRRDLGSAATTRGRRHDTPPTIAPATRCAGAAKATRSGILIRPPLALHRGGCHDYYLLTAYTLTNERAADVNGDLRPLPLTLASQCDTGEFTVCYAKPRMPGRLARPHFTAELFARRR